MAKEIKAKFGEVSILVNNAGVVYSNDIIDAREEDIEQTFRVNVLAQFWDQSVCEIINKALGADRAMTTIVK
nr:hypothetical protein BaRGS_031217 [Batillaria attramentaria]